MKKYGLSRKAILVPIRMLAAMWIGFALQSFGFFDHCFGAVIPLVGEGLLGIITAPLLHGNLDHILSNSVPIAVLLFLLYQFYPKIASKIFATGWLLSGFLLWILPPFDPITGAFTYSCTIGASGIVYVLAFFLFFSGILRRNIKLIAVSLVVVLYYGSLIWGIFPEEFFKNLQEPSQISWQAHAAGAFVGIILAFMYKDVGERKKKFIWEFPNYYNEKDDLLWQSYKETHPDDFNELPQKKTDDIWEHLEELRKK